MKVAFLFPGQGSQQPGMLHELPRHPAISETLAEASEILQQDVLAWDSKKALQSTAAVQVALFVAGVASARALQQEGASADFVAGHSVGAFCAAVVADALDFRDGLELVRLRGQLMERAHPQGFGMGVVLGLPERRVAGLVERLFSPEDPVYLANVNAVQQLTISGSLSGISRVLDAARQEGARKAELLPVNVPSHCQLMLTVAAELAEASKRTAFRQAKILYAANRTARSTQDAEAIRDDLGQSLAHPVRWHDATSGLFERGARLFIEMPPGQVLTNLAKQAFPSARAVSVSEAGIRGCVILAQRCKAIE